MRELLSKGPTKTFLGKTFCNHIKVLVVSPVRKFMNGENVQHIYQKLFTTTLLTLIVPGNSDLKQVSRVGWQEMQLGSCSQDYVQFGRDILFVTTHLSR